MKIIDSIDELTVKTYSRIIETGDIRHLGSGRFLFLFPKRLLKAWEKIEEEMLTEWLKDREYLRALEDDKREVLQIVKGKMSSVSSEKTIANALLKQREAREQDRDQEKNQLHETLSALKQALGFHIPTDQYTMKEYINDINHLKKQVRENEKARKNNN
jgi:hypothetical protein